jgi:hypothetical protein
MSVNIDFGAAIPAQFGVDSPLSTSKAVLSKSLMEFQPQEQQIFTPLGSSIIRTNLSSNHGFAILPESYFRCKIKRKAIPPSAAYGDGELALDVGGIHACIKSFEVRSVSGGTLIQRKDNYNVEYALKSLILQSPEEVLQKGWVSADSLSEYASESAYRSGKILKPAEINGTNHNGVDFSWTTGGLVNVAGGKLLTQVQPGDIFHYNGAVAGRSISAEITSVISDVQFQIGSSVAVAQGVGNGTALDSYYIEKREMVPSARTAALFEENVDVTVCFQPLMSIWQENLPLWLFKGGLEFTIELELSHRAMRTATGLVSAAKAVQYEISDLRLMAMIATPDKEVKNMLNTKWNSSEGLVYALPSTRVRKFTGNASSAGQSIQVNVGVRSARRCYHVIMDSQLSEGNNAVTLSNHSVSGFLKDKLTKYQFRVGSHEFPNRDVVVDTQGLEVLQQLIHIVGNRNMRLTYGDWVDDQYQYTINTNIKAADSRHFINAVDFSRDNGPNSNLTGMDLSIVPLDYIFEAGSTHASRAWAGNPIHYFFVEHDSFMKLSAEGLVILN